jgi:hypothetical protein
MHIVVNCLESPSNDALVPLVPRVSRLVLALALGLVGLLLALVLLLILALVWVPYRLRALASRSNRARTPPLATTDHSLSGPDFRSSQTPASFVTTSDKTPCHGAISVREEGGIV